MEIDVSIVIVNYNTHNFIKSCLDSIIAFTTGLNYEIIIVDNNSPDRCIEKFQNLYQSASFLFRDVNDGFGGGCNYGATRAHGKYIAFVNPDTTFINNALRELFQIIEKNPGYGLVSGCFLNNNREITYSYNKFPGVYWELIQNYFGAKLYVKNLIKNLNVSSQHNISLDVDWIYGACMFMKSNLFKEIGGFNSSYFLYYEDVDLQYRIKGKGYKVVCFPYIGIIHSVNSSIINMKGRFFSDFHYNRSKMIYFYNHTGNLVRNFIRIINISAILFRMIKLPINSKYKNYRKERFCSYISCLKLYIVGKERLLNSNI